MDSHRCIKAVILCVISAVLGITYLKFKLVWFWGAYLLKIVLGLFIILFLFTATSNRKIGNRFSLWLETYLMKCILVMEWLWDFLLTQCPNYLLVCLF